MGALLVGDGLSGRHQPWLSLSRLAAGALGLRSCSYRIRLYARTSPTERGALLVDHPPPPLDSPGQSRPSFDAGSRTADEADVQVLSWDVGPAAAPPDRPWFPSSTVSTDKTRSALRDCADFDSVSCF